MTEYGLSGLRDADGELQTVTYEYEWNNDQIKIKFDPPTLSQQEKIENLDEDADPETLEEILNEHMVKPKVSEDSSWTAREMWCYITGLIKWSSGMDDTMMQDIEEEIESRTSGEGN